MATNLIGSRDFFTLLEKIDRQGTSHTRLPPGYDVDLDEATGRLVFRQVGQGIRAELDPVKAEN